MYANEFGRARVVDGCAEVELPIMLHRYCDMSRAEVFVTARFDPEENRIPVVAASAIKDGRFSIRELNHGHCEVSWQVVAPYLP